MTLQKFSQIFTKIALIPLRTNLFHIVLSAIFLTIGGLDLRAQEIPVSPTVQPAEENTDSLNVTLAPVVINDTVIRKRGAVINSAPV